MLTLCNKLIQGSFFVSCDTNIPDNIFGHIRSFSKYWHPLFFNPMRQYSVCYMHCILPSQLSISDWPDLITVRFLPWKNLHSSKGKVAWTSKSHIFSILLLAKRAYKFVRTLSVSVFWVVTPHELTGRYKLFGETCIHLFQALTSLEHVNTALLPRIPFYRLWLKRLENLISSLGLCQRTDNLCNSPIFWRKSMEEQNTLARIQTVDAGHFRCDVMWPCMWVPTFWTNILLRAEDEVVITQNTTVDIETLWEP